MTPDSQDYDEDDEEPRKRSSVLGSHTLAPVSVLAVAATMLVGLAWRTATTLSSIDSNLAAFNVRLSNLEALRVEDRSDRMSRASAEAWVQNFRDLNPDVRVPPLR